MYFQFPCSHCGKNLKVSEENAGRRVRCPYCHGAMTVQPPKEMVPSGFPELTDPSSTGGTARPKTKSTGETKQPESAESGTTGTDVPMLKSALIAICLSVAFYLIAILPFHKMYFGKLFLERGWVQYVLVFLMSWCVGILYLKSRKLVRQKESMLFDLLPNSISPSITQETVGKFVNHIRGLPAKASESFLINRVLRGLEHFRVLNSHSEVASRLASQSEIDATSVDSSYTIIKVFIWAIPILGFIGTVIGIGGAVGGFSATMEASQDVEALKTALGGVTGGLATAFDTTLVALVMSILVMFPVSSMQKAEEDLLNWVDEYCNENFLRRLKDGGRRDKSDGDVGDEIQKAIDKSMAAHHTELRNWTKKLETIGSTITKQIAKGLAEIEDKQREKRVNDFEKASAAVLEKQGKLANLISGAQEHLTKLQRGQATQFENLARSCEKTQTQTSESMRQSAQALHAYFANLHQGLTVLNGVLEQLGEKQVVVQMEVQEPARRGWGIFGRKNGGMRRR